MLKFKMFAEVKFNREIDLSRDYISLGGFEMVMSGTVFTLILKTILPI